MSSQTDQPKVPQVVNGETSTISKLESLAENLDNLIHSLINEAVETVTQDKSAKLKKQVQKLDWELSKFKQLLKEARLDAQIRKLDAEIAGMKEQIEEKQKVVRELSSGESVVLVV